MMQLAKKEVLPKTYDECFVLKARILRQLEEIEDALADPDVISTFRPQRHYAIWYQQQKKLLTFYQTFLKNLEIHIESLSHRTTGEFEPVAG